MTTIPTSSQPARGHQTFWLWAMCLTGVDYFSTLGYQPSIAHNAAGLLAPMATLILVLVTLFGAYPIYSYVASRSFHGLGSIGMLEKLLHGWLAKVLVITLLGFAATDFVITKTLSAADAAEHIIHNPYWPFHSQADDDAQRLYITMGLLVLLGGFFLKGFKEVIGVAVVIVGIYLVMNFIVLGVSISFLVANPGFFDAWLEKILAGKEHWHVTHVPELPISGWLGILAISLLMFPKLALGLSGFETGVAIMGLIRGKPGDTHENPKGRIANTKKLLLTAAIIMSLCLVGSSLAVSLLIPPEDLGMEGAPGEFKAKDRAIAYLAHGESPHLKGFPLGPVFGTLYDASTVAILWFAGASAMAALINLVPQYLPRYGMGPEWSRAVRPMVVFFTLVNLLVTYIFKADVDDQAGAYATGVLVLILSACIACMIEIFKSRKGMLLLRIPWYFLGITLVFAYTTVAVMIEKPDGIKIAGCFIGVIFLASVVSRFFRSTEMRMGSLEFANEESRFLWESLLVTEFPVLVPHRPGHRGLISKEEIIRRDHRLSPDIPILFLEVQRGDTSDFLLNPLVEIKQEEGRFILKVSRCASIAHVIAGLSLELGKSGKPPEIHFGWSAESPMAANLGFLLFGEGNVPWMVRELISKAQPNPEKQPRIIIG
ncbi:MAG: amino acid transporter [Gemmataceae bacterium]|nr:amino acid transporter [Gemmataceae bacterium]